MGLFDRRGGVSGRKVVGGMTNACSPEALPLSVQHRVPGS